MPGYVHRNEDFRAKLPTVGYPFSERSSLESEELFIGNDVFTDACIFLKEAADLPLHISSIDGTRGELGSSVVNISDRTGLLVATCELTGGQDEHTVYSTQGLIVGVLVTHRPGLSRFLGRTAGTLFDLATFVAELVPDVTFVAKARYLRYARLGNALIGDGGFDQTVNVIAGHGMKFTHGDGVLRLHLLGDAETVLANGLRSVNGVQSPSIWLTTHPLSNLRLSSEEGRLNFVSGRDAT
jgi:hypothetical protein